MINLKDRPMAVQIWIILGLVLGLAFALITILSPVVLRYSFTSETYARIDEAQEYLLEYGNLNEINNNHFYPRDDKRNPPSRDEHPPFRIVQHILITKDNLSENELPEEVLSQIKEEAFKQQDNVQHYHLKTGKNEIFYAIRKIHEASETIYLASFLWERYRNNLVQLIFKRLIRLLIFILIISWIASIAIARYLSRPLVHLQERVKDLAVRKWEDPIKLNRQDEIGKLGKSIDWMRMQLLEQDQNQQSFLQQVSHELKTPIMVIRSYVQSINDGIFPRGDMESSLEVIEEETGRLEKRVNFLLNFTKYEYLTKHQLEMERFDIADLLEKTIQNFFWRNTDINWEYDFDTIVIDGDMEQLKIAVENILDNQIRYAEDTIIIELDRREKVFADRQGMRTVNSESGIESGRESGIESGREICLIRIWNNGPAIEEKLMDNIFKKYRSGYEGNFGLGLAIARLIVDLHQGEMWVQNEEDGVAFYIEIPLNLA